MKYEVYNHLFSRYMLAMAMITIGVVPAARLMIEQASHAPKREDLMTGRFLAILVGFVSSGFPVALFLKRFGVSDTLKGFSEYYGQDHLTGAIAWVLLVMNVVVVLSTPVLLVVQYRMMLNRNYLRQHPVD